MQDINDDIGSYKDEIATKEEWEALEKCMKEVLGDEYKGEDYEEYLKVANITHSKSKQQTI